ncbi:hypothetical protein ABW20_dc0108697 [Dactylellina cionopaga]|nr:hypothetical protein ABW20_dc0108697 [Dactylellina cionopaga]
MPSSMTNLGLQLKRLCLNSINRYIYRLNVTNSSNPKAFVGLTSQTTTLPYIPELYDPNYLDILLPPPARDSVAASRNAPIAPTNPMISALQDVANQVRTENNAPAYHSTGDVLLDAFHHPHARQPSSELAPFFTPAWDNDPEVTLRIIFYLRSIHEGKSDKKLFYRAWHWLYVHHPRTAIHNLRQLVELKCPRKPRKGDGDRQVPGMPHGYWKDLLNILCLVTTGRLGKSDHFNWGNGRRVKGYKGFKSRKLRENARHATVCKRLEDPKYRALYITIARLFAERLSQDNALLVERNATRDPVERSNLRWQISLAGKWAPTPGCAHDRITNISTAISQLLHSSRHSHPLKYPSSLSQFDHKAALNVEQAGVLRSYFQRWVLSPLRTVHQVPEPFMSANRWSEIAYNHVPAVCMQNNSSQFLKHDRERFSNYMFDVSVGKKTISGATLLPHEILMRLMEYNSDIQLLHPDKSDIDKVKQEFFQTQIDVASAQWKTLVERLREEGEMDNAVAVCDVSASMGTLRGFKKRSDPEPIFPALAMSMLLASLAKPPFNSGFISFSESPQFLRIDNSVGLTQAFKAMAGSDWGMNTDLQKVFNGLLLPLAKKNNVKKEDMIKRLFIFSDMQFDEAGGQRYTAEAETKSLTWETNYDLIEKEYKEAGYDVPEIVFWDLGTEHTVETAGDRKGVAMMKGFSGSMMKVFLGDKDEDIVKVDGGEQKGDGDTVAVDGAKEEEGISPAKIMRKAVMRNSFDGLVVLD